MHAPGFAVIDFETTGLFPGGHDRIVEVAVVHVNEFGRVTGQWETLINPERDLGPQHIHGIRAAEVLTAPRFREIAGHIVELLDGRVLVAHNASFDIRFLEAELQRAGYLPPILAEASLCTMQLARDIIPGAGRSLADCCAAFDIDLDGAHRASVDAFATARLLGEYIATMDDAEFWLSQVDAAARRPWPPLMTEGDRHTTWRARGASNAADPATFLERITHKLPEHAGPAEHQDYLALLDRALLDRHLSVHEAESLVGLAESLGIARVTCEQLHRTYFDDVAGVAWADGVLTVAEIADLAAVASLLSIPAVVVANAVAGSTGPGGPEAEASHSADARSEPFASSGFFLAIGDEVVLTGDMIRARESWHVELSTLGLVPKPAITKKIKLVVAADPDSLSGKARKARDYGIPIVHEAALTSLISPLRVD